MSGKLQLLDAGLQTAAASLARAAQSLADSAPCTGMRIHSETRLNQELNEFLHATSQATKALVTAALAASQVVTDLRQETTRFDASIGAR